MDESHGAENAHTAPISTPVPITSPIKTKRIHNSARLSNPTDGIESPLSPPSDEDELAGPERLVADPDSPTSRYLERAALRSLQEAQNSSTPERRFSFLNDIARNPRLAAAARAELDAASGCPSPMAPGSGGNAPGSASSGGTTAFAQTPKLQNQNSGGATTTTLTYFQHSTEIERQTALIQQLDTDAEQESKINQGMANVMLGRLQSGKSAAERVLSVLQAFSSAESAYARAMDALSIVNLPGEADGATLRVAMTEFSELPASLAGLHSGVADALAPIIQSVRTVVAELRTACEEIGLGTTSAQKSVDLARKGLKTALTSHREACRAFDAALLERQKVGSRSRSVESDPWIAEGRLVEKQAALQAAQTHQRRYLAGAFRRAGELERKRVEVACTALASLVELPRTTAFPDVAQAGEKLAQALARVDCEADLDAFSAVAANSVRNGDSLSSRQAELVEHLVFELTTSAEIVRQGEVQRYDPAKGLWLVGYCVLTRAGFLHWFAAPENGDPPSAWGSSGGPVLSLNLARCEFEQGEAPAWRLIENSGGGLNTWLGGGRKSVALRTERDVESCMGWAADLREIIAICCSK